MVPNNKLWIFIIILILNCIASSAECPCSESVSLRASNVKTITLCDQSVNIEVIGVNTQSSIATIKIDGSSKSVSESDSFQINNLNFIVNDIFSSVAPVVTGGIKLTITNTECANEDDQIETNSDNLRITDFSYDSNFMIDDVLIKTRFNICNYGLEKSKSYQVTLTHNYIKYDGYKWEGLMPNKCRNEQISFHVNESANIWISVYDWQGVLIGDSKKKEIDVEINHTCINDSDCDDDKKSTLDLCSGYPRKCTFNDILICKNNDSYCPVGCNMINDNDCDECKIDADCDDDEKSTINFCRENPKRCIFEQITLCHSNDGYCPDGCKFPNDVDCDECKSDSDCNDLDVLTDEKCIGTPKRCEIKSKIPEQKEKNETKIQEITKEKNDVSLNINSEENVEINDGNAEAFTSKKVKVEDEKLIMETQKGEKEIKIMPSSISKKAINELELTKFDIELKEIGKPIYEVKGEKGVKLFGMFNVKMKITSEIDANTGIIETTKKPWWKFLAKE